MTSAPFGSPGRPVRQASAVRPFTPVLPVRGSSRLFYVVLALLATLAGALPPCLAAAPAGSAAALPRGAPAPEGPLVAFLGDSLTAGLGLPKDSAYPALVAWFLQQEGTPIRVINAGISGDTSAGGLRRVDWLLRQKPDVLVVALGANDGLRGLPVEDLERNLREIARRARAAGARVLLAGMLVPPSLGRDYAVSFAQVYPTLAKEQGVALMPFLLEGVAGRPEFNQPDGIHPTAQGQELIARGMLPYLKKLLATKQAAHK